MWIAKQRTKFAAQSIDYSHIELNYVLLWVLMLISLNENIAYLTMEDDSIEFSSLDLIWPPCNNQRLLEFYKITSAVGVASLLHCILVIEEDMNTRTMSLSAPLPYSTTPSDMLRLTRARHQASLPVMLLILLMLLLQSSACSNSDSDTTDTDTGIENREDTGTSDNCPNNLTPCSASGTSTLTCVDTNTDSAHCGTCGNRCAQDEHCSEGECMEVPCPQDQTRCQLEDAEGGEASVGECHNLDTSRTHCGQCGNSCQDGYQCLDGECTLICPPSQQACDNTCTQTSSDWENCGSCGNQCDSNQLCNEGICSTLPCGPGLLTCNNGCIDPAYNHLHCGGCNRACPPSHTCNAGQCALWCPDGMEKCGNTCTWTTEDATNCGTCGNRCPAGAACQNGSCNTLVRGVRINRSSAKLVPGASVTLTATVEPVNATNKSVIWQSSAPQVAEVSSAGLVTGRSSGQATISVITMDGAYRSYCLVDVVQNVTGIQISPQTMGIAAGRNGTLTATVIPDNASDQTVIWSSSDPAIAMVNNMGNVTGIAPGQCTITATTQDKGLMASATVTITTVPVTGITVTPTTIRLMKGKQATINTIITPPNASNRKVIWLSRDPHIATIDGELGMVRGVNAGTTEISVITQDGGFTARATVTVEVPVTFLNLSKTTMAIERFSKGQLTATVLPADATNPGVTWTSSNPAVATILPGTDPNPNDGIHFVLIDARKVGQAIISATTLENGYQAECTVNVWETPATGISVTPESATMQKGSQLQLNATVLPPDATDKKVTWLSNNTGVATVEADTGLVTAVNYGLTAITARTISGGFTAHTEILVAVPVSGVTLNQTNITFDMGDVGATLTATVIPANATNQAVHWSSSNPAIFSVDQSGKITLVSFIERAEGVITVTTEDGGFQATCHVETTYYPGTMAEPIAITNPPANCQEYRNHGFTRDAWYRMSNGVRYCELSAPQRACISPTWGQVCVVASPATSSWSFHCPTWQTCPTGSHIAMNMDFQQSPCASYSNMSSGLGAYTHDVWYYDENGSRTCSSGPNNWGSCSTGGCNSTGYGGSVSSSYYRDGINARSGIRNSGRSDSSCSRGNVCVRDW